ncbi:MAG TPA: hypothetical protein VNI83_02100 [Vicinamibacterales bacterium]|nr:hypothetical protein [Vicinamibacterales bacterium]
MSVKVTITVEDVDEQLETYAEIELERADSAAGPYAQIATAPLVSGTYSYVFTDSSGDLNKWYRWRLHHDTGPVNSAYSNPFQPEGVTRKKIRQYALTNFRAGLVLLATSGGSSTSIPTTSYRFKSSLYRANRGKGTWLHVTTGNRAGETSMVTATDPPNGTLTVNPALSGALSSGDEFEWHWLVDPSEWNDAINRAAARYYQLERVPIAGVADREEYDLSELAPWLASKEDVYGLWHYPKSANATPDGEDHPFQGEGRWWGVRQDGHRFTLTISPAVAAGKHFYLEAARPMPRLYTDASAGPDAAKIDLWAALAYDEVLDFLTRPHVGSSKDHSVWERERARFRAETLVPLLNREVLAPRPQPPRLPTPPVYPRHVTAR